MEYTIHKLATLAGVSTRTLRYYDQIGLLQPLRTNSAGYRIYGAAQVDRLQQILFYRELGLELKQIAALLDGPGFDSLTALRGHLGALQARRRQLDALIDTVAQTIHNQERGIKMNDSDKFAGFKMRLVADNEAQYGAEARQTYGDAAVEASNARMLNLTNEEYYTMEELNNQLLALLAQAVAGNADPAGALGQQAYALHKQWLGYTWESYRPEAHAGLVQMYIDDPRFTAYYDAQQPGCARFLRNAVLAQLDCAAAKG